MRRVRAYLIRRLRVRLVEAEISAWVVLIDGGGSMETDDVGSM
jgi:hypothetical protein